MAETRAIEESISEAKSWRNLVHERTSSPVIIHVVTERATGVISREIPYRKRYRLPYLVHLNEGLWQNLIILSLQAFSLRAGEFDISRRKPAFKISLLFSVRELNPTISYSIDSPIMNSALVKPLLYDFTRIVHILW